MATILKQNQQDQEKQDQAIMTSGQSSQITPQAGGQPSAPTGGGQVPQQPSSSGRFTNIQSFIRANRDGQLGQMVGAKAGEEKAKSVGELQKAKTTAEGQLGSVAEGVEAARSKVPAAISALSSNSFSPTADSADTAIADLSSALNYRYQGPEGLGNQTRLAGEAQNLQALGQASKTEGGRSALLQRFFGRERPTYSQGQTRLDTLLLGREQDALGGLRRVGREFGRDLQQTQQNIAGQIKQQKEGITGLQTFAREQGEEAFGKSIEAGKEAGKKQGSAWMSDLQDIVNQTTSGLGFTGLDVNEAVAAGLITAPPDVIQRAASGNMTDADIAVLSPQIASTAQKLADVLGLSRSLTVPAGTSVQGPQANLQGVQSLESELGRASVEASQKVMPSPDASLFLGQASKEEAQIWRDEGKAAADYALGIGPKPANYDRIAKFITPQVLQTYSSAMTKASDEAKRRIIARIGGEYSMPGSADQQPVQAIAGGGLSRSTLIPME